MVWCREAPERIDEILLPDPEAEPTARSPTLRPPDSRGRARRAKPSLQRTWTAVSDALAGRYTTILDSSASAIPAAFANARPYWIFSAK
jgi:hypothetical protein